MGEEEKKAEESKKAEEEKKEVVVVVVVDENENENEMKKEEKKSEGGPPLQEIVLKVFMHCEGCARKVRRCLKSFEGVEDVITDCRTSKVVVKGEKADPLKVLARVQRKSHRQVHLISPLIIPKPPKDKQEEEEEELVLVKKEEVLPVITVVMRVYMHCEACAQEIKKRILRMKGVESAEAELKGSQVTVKGAFEPEKLIDFVHKRSGKQAVIVKVEPEEKEEEKAAEAEEEGGGAKKTEAEKGACKESGGGDAPPPKPEVDDTKLELKKNDYHPQINYPQDMMYAYPPQIFSDENPNACSVM